MSIVMVQRCLSAEPWFEMSIPSSEPGKEYHVVVPWPDDGVDDITCECMSFIHRGWCRHQEEAFESLCRWTSLEGPEKQTSKERQNHVCPRCGSQTISDAEFD